MACKETARAVRTPPGSAFGFLPTVYVRQNKWSCRYDRSARRLHRGIEFTKTGLIIPEGLDFQGWKALGGSLQAIHRSIHWWIGDWLRFGEAKFGERYVQAIEETLFAYQTLANDVWVAKAIEPSRRKEKLTFGHHAVVAALPPAKQDEWLDKAEQGQWSTRKLWEKARRPSQPAVLYRGLATVTWDGDVWGVDLPPGTRLHSWDGAEVEVEITEVK
jgi:hypothetical protein